MAHHTLGVSLTISHLPEHFSGFGWSDNVGMPLWSSISKPQQHGNPTRLHLQGFNLLMATLCNLQCPAMLVGRKLDYYWQDAVMLPTLDPLPSPEAGTLKCMLNWHTTSLSPRPKTNPSLDCFQYRAHFPRIILEVIYAQD